MRKLKVALIVKPSPSTRERSKRNMGYWSYPVDEFEWDHFAHVNKDAVRTGEFKDYDAIFHEDGGNWVRYIKQPFGPPVVFLSIDDTLSDHHLKERMTQSETVDLILVDHGELAPFKSVGAPVKRFNYCVNDKMFLPRKKEFSVNNMCARGARKGNPGGEQRNMLRQYLNDVCLQHGWTFLSRVEGAPSYARKMGASKVVVNLPRVPGNRPHRIFDAMASMCAVLTGSIPRVVGDLIESGIHYRTFDKFEDIPANLYDMLQAGAWQDLAVAGHEVVMSCHTWKFRARQLRLMLKEELGL